MFAGEGIVVSAGATDRRRLINRTVSSTKRTAAAAAAQIAHCPALSATVPKAVSANWPSRLTLAIGGRTRQRDSALAAATG